MLSTASVSPKSQENTFNLFKITSFVNFASYHLEFQQLLECSNILKPVIALLRTRGISLIYLDDLLIAAGTYIDCMNRTKQVISLLGSLGFRINCEKPVIIPTQKLEYLGFITDTSSMTLALPVEKFSRYNHQPESFLQQKSTISIRLISRSIGLCTSVKHCCLPSTSALSITSVSKKLCFKGSPIIPQSVQSKGSPGEHGVG